ncbi:FtsX-like permease family protein [Lacticaseibacillus yichunensis]|uniref:FtsX-like permease family protein n=1 Tax=Lacticaseibacillus yichunensis TaxID=2486015 RepID=A0ABW4CRM1_9LACO|nr:FtsX-like permease family protein [Lacticaseibacillus yichunensis]
MTKHILWKDIWQAIGKSKGRFLSIAGLMAIGSFALVGLKVAGPDMRATGADYANRLNVADVTVIGDYGLDQSDQAKLKAVKGTSKVEYGYLKDVTIKGKTTSLRLFSKPSTISTYDVKAGRMPTAVNEVALDAEYQGQYKLGDTLRVTEKADATGAKVLRRTKFKIVGFVSSGEILSSVNMGETTAGTGELNGYAVILPSAFDSDVYMLARMRFTDLKTVDPYGNTYKDRLQTHKTAIDKALKTQPKNRLAQLQTEAETTIASNQAKLDAAAKKLSDTQAKLQAGRRQLDAGQAELTAKQKALTTQVTAAQKKLDDGAAQLKTAAAKLSAAKQQLAQADTKLRAGAQELATKRDELAKAEAKLATAQKQLTAAAAQLKTAKQQLTTGQQTIAKTQATLTSKKKQLTAANTQYKTGLAQLQAAVAQLEKQLAQSGLSATQQAQLTAQLKATQANLTATQQAYATFQSGTYDPGMAQIAAGTNQLAAAKSELAQKQKQYDASEARYQTQRTAYPQGKAKAATAQTQITQGAKTLAASQQLYEKNLATYNAGLKEYQAKTAELAQGKATLATQKQSGEAQLAAAKKTLASKEQTYKKGAADFAKQAPAARAEIKSGETKLVAAKKQVKQLALPTYTAYSRREMPGGIGYKTYTTVSEIIDALANVFPIFLYFVAALVTFTTMGRFVDEERINAGTLRALGYEPKDVTRKFTVYGFAASMLGTLIGVAAGHTLLPLIVYNAYSDGFTLPRITLAFHPWVTLAAIALALLSAVLPAYLSAKGELAANPAELLLPKPPVAGSKIFLERITPVWNHLSFTHKVTARNTFRYKKRMLMTIFGVAGAVALLLTGYSVRASIGGMSQTQFGGIIHYDMIVAKNSGLTSAETREFAKQAESDAIKSTKAIHYESLSKVAGKNNDSQAITLIVPQTTAKFEQYVETRNRKTQTALPLQSSGAIISERLANLVGAKVGDTISFKDASDVTRHVTISGITEMYMGHFMIMSRTAYEKAFATDYTTNGELVILKNRSQANVEAQAAKFMALSATAGVVQNTTLTNQIDTIVKSLNKIMLVLIIVAGLLGVVILYNLTNINVSERIRELSTIKVLGFFDNEVTMYIYRETILLTGIGILVGFGIGDVLFRYILAVVPPDEVMFNPALVGTSFLWPTLLIAVITAVLGWVVSRTLKNVDMLAALKSVD